MQDSSSARSTHLLTVGALYSGIARGLTADVLAAESLGHVPQPVCASLIAASHGRVTDVLNVPTDSVAAQLEHIRETCPVSAARIGIVGHPETVAAIFKETSGLDGPVVLDITLSGPSGEDLIGSDGVDAIVEHLDRPDLVAIRKVDAQLLVEMEISTLADAQVALQRMHQRGAGHVLLRCGQMTFAGREEPQNGQSAPMDVDFFYDGEEISLFEAPHMPEADVLSGASSALSIAIIDALLAGRELPDAIQSGKAYTSEALRAATDGDSDRTMPDYFWRLRRELTSR